MEQRMPVATAELMMMMMFNSQLCCALWSNQVLVYKSSTRTQDAFVLIKKVHGGVPGLYTCHALGDNLCRYVCSASLPCSVAHKGSPAERGGTRVAA